MYCMRKLRSFGPNSDILVTFYNAVICSLIMFGSVCWGGNISKFGRRRLETIVKLKQQAMFLESQWTVWKETVQKTNANIKWHYNTHPTRHYFDSRRSNRNGRFLLPRTNTNRYKASFLASALSVFNKRMMAFQGRAGMCVHNDFISFESFYVWFAIDNIISGNFGFARY